MTNDELTWQDRFDLLEFWGFCDSIENEMMKNTKNPVKELPLSNRMICYTYAASVWEKHKKAVKAENRKNEITEAFIKEYGSEMIFDIGFSATTKPTRFFWGKLEDIIEKAGLDEQDKFLAATESDFTKLGGVGKAGLAKLLRAQKTILAHREFFANHPDYVNKEVK